MLINAKIQYALVLSAAIGLATTTIASADVFDFNFSGPNVSGMGTLTAALDSSGNYYDVTGASGTITDNDSNSLAQGTFTITGISPYASADNQLYYPASANSAQGYSNSMSFVDTSGISVQTSTGVAFNVYAGVSGNNAYDLINSADNAGGTPFAGPPVVEAIDSGNVTPVNGAPAPLAGAGLLSFFGAGGLAMRKRAKQMLASLFASGAAVA